MEVAWKERIRQRLLRIPPRRNPAASQARAAVLMGLLDCAGEPSFLLTKRTLEVATHKGQICFPGGVEECGDRSLWQTALRETGEEVGIEPEYVELLGRFHDYQAVTDIHVACYVGFLRPGFSLMPSPAEVERVLQVPYDFFRDTRPLVETRHRGGRPIPVYFYDYQGDSIWGLTARMIRDFLDALGDWT